MSVITTNQCLHSPQTVPHARLLWANGNQLTLRKDTTETETERQHLSSEQIKPSPAFLVGGNPVRGQL